MTAEEIRLHLSYSGWASRKLLDAALALSEEQQHREFGVSHKSLMGTLEHTFLADRGWFARTVDPRVLQSEEPFSIAWPKLQKRWEDWAAALSHPDIVRIVDYKDLKGNPHRTPVWQIVLHVVNHATLHRGQAMSLLRQLGAEAPPTDLIFYYRETKGK
jgi:uncharacterized damage-inducible protein DinB